MDGKEKARSSRSRSSSRNNYNLSSSIKNVFGAGDGSRLLSGNSTSPRRGAAEDEEALRWAAIEKLPTYDRLRTSIIKSFEGSDDHDHDHEVGGHGNGKLGSREVDVRKLDIDDRHKFIDALLKVADEDNEKFLTRFRNRVDK